MQEQDLKNRKTKKTNKSENWLRNQF